MTTQTTSAYKRLLLTFIVTISLLTLNQQVIVAAVTYRFTGKVINRISSKPIEMATVRIPSLGLWAITDRNGKFSIPKLKAGKYSYEIRLLGYSTANGEVTIGDNTKEIVIKMDEQSLALKNITVTAKEQKSGSVSKIDMNAIQHLQPKSVEDLLQLVPGNVTKNPDLNSVGQAQIRELGSSSTNALGTAVVVNGAPLSNDGNMQSLSTAKHGTTIYSYDEQGTTGRGVDLRIISPDNIESMEVIRGIPSVEYGNLTSGAIVISTKSGYTPFEAKAKIDPNSKMFYLGKGFDLKNNNGTFNLSADYSQSYNDIRERYKGYDRFTFGASYANKFMEHTKPLTLKIDANMFTTLNSVKTDPQMKEHERIKNENTGIRLNLEAKWRLDMAWITNMSFNAMANYTHQNDYRMQKVFLPTGMTPISESYVSGEFESHFQEASYYSEYTIDGKPFDFYAQLKADKLFQITDKAYNTIKIGAEFRLNKNYGDGMMFDTKYPPEVSGNQSIRPRAYKDVPSLRQLVGFIEDKWFQPIGNMSFTIQAGARFTNMFIEKEKALRGNIFSFEPRFNMELNILNSKNNKFFDNLSISGGYGIASKMPPMLYLYPDKAYFDVTSLAAMTERYKMVVMTT
ncbi:MAG: TonB-dependent receptor, partial [Prevotellaceae bacterium]|nr:TonB-dependent receptor [Candidatus Faecinaster equi]